MGPGFRQDDTEDVVTAAPKLNQKWPGRCPAIHDHSRLLYQVFFNATRNSASVLALTSSSETPSASSISAMPPLPCLSMVKTARSVTTMSTTRSPVSGRLH